jgi:hypothetical protein
MKNADKLIASSYLFKLANFNALAPNSLGQMGQQLGTTLGGAAGGFVGNLVGGQRMGQMLGNKYGIGDTLGGIAGSIMGGQQLGNIAGKSLGGQVGQNIGGLLDRGLGALNQGFNSNPMQSIKNLTPRTSPGYLPENKLESVNNWNTPDKDFIPPSGNQYQDYLKSLNSQHGQDPGFAPQSGTPSYQGARRLPYRPPSSQANKPQFHLL